MTTVSNRTQIFPIPPDNRMTDDILGLVADLLTHHGYPFIDGADLDRLREALRHFLYGPAWCPGAPAGSDGECRLPGPHQPHMIVTTPVTALCEFEDTGWCAVHEGFHPGRLRPARRERLQDDRRALVEVIRGWSI